MGVSPSFFSPSPSPSPSASARMIANIMSTTISLPRNFRLLRHPPVLCEKIIPDGAFLELD